MTVRDILRQLPAFACFIVATAAICAALVMLTPAA